MFKVGLLKTGGKNYYVYEVSNRKYYRLDICNEGTQFHVDPDNILYSVYRKKKEFVYGDVELKNKLDEIIRLVGNSRAETESESKWENGKFITIQSKIDKANDIVSEIVKENNIPVKETLKYKEEVLAMQTAKDIADMDMEPLNAHQYVSSQIEKSYKQDILFNDLGILKSRFNLQHLLARDYKTITDLSEAQAYLLKIVEAAKAGKRKIGVDTETTGTDMNYFGKDRITGVVVSIGKDESRYFPFGHDEFENLPMWFFHKLMETLISVQEESGGHNIKFEHKVAYKYGHDWCIRHDSFEASIINDPRVQRGIHALKTLESKLDGRKYLEFDDIFIGEPNFAKLPKDLATIYACPDPDGTINVLEDQLDIMDKNSLNQNFIYRIECELANLKAEQEYWGFRIDHEGFIKGLDNCEYVVNSLENLIKQLSGKSDFNINSHEQMANHLYNELHCPIVSRTSNGKPGTGKKAIVKLAHIKRKDNDKVVRAVHDFIDKEGNVVVAAKDLNEARYPICVLLLAYTKYNKLLTGFYNRLLKSSTSQFKVDVLPNGRRRVKYVEEDGKRCVRFFFWINANGTESGRQSSTMHTMPPTIKEFFLPDSEDHEMLAADYNQVEMRVLSSLAGEEDLKELCSNPDNDIHRVIGSLITGEEIWEISEEERKKDKPRNFGVVYGISASGLAEQMYGAMPKKEEIAECNVSIMKFFQRFNKIQMFIDNNERKIRENGEIFTMWNRVRRFPQMFDETIDNKKRAALVRQGNNMPVQGTAADIMKLAEVKYYRYIKKKGWDKLVDTPQGKYPLVRIMLSVHDEVEISRHKSIPIEEVLEMQRECQEIKLKDFAPLFANPAVIGTWADGKEDKYEIPRGLRDKLIEDYKRTGKSAFPPNTLVKDAMAKMIKDFLNEELIDYMESMIAKHGDNPDELYLHIKHPKLTHSLISLYRSKDHKKLSHMERIRYAVGDFLEKRAKGELDGVDIVIENDKKDDAELIDGLKDITGFVDSVVNLDKDGEVLEEIDEDEEEYVEESTEEICKKVTFVKKYCWAQRDSYTVDASTLTIQECDKVLDFIEDQYESPTGILRIMLLYGGKLLDTNMRSDTLDTKEVDKFIESIKEQRTDNILFNAWNKRGGSNEKI